MSERNELRLFKPPKPLSEMTDAEIDEFAAKVWAASQPAGGQEDDPE